jgi:hypothetical protein
MSNLLLFWWKKTGWMTYKNLNSFQESKKYRCALRLIRKYFLLLHHNIQNYNNGKEKEKRN